MVKFMNPKGYVWRIFIFPTIVSLSFTCVCIPSYVVLRSLGIREYSLFTHMAVFSLGTFVGVVVFAITDKLALFPTEGNSPKASSENK